MSSETVTPQKRIAMVCTRYTNRPLHHEFVRNITKLDWRNSAADLYIYWHGDYPVLTTTELQLIPEVKEVAYVEGTQGKFPPMTKYIFNDFIPYDEYEFIGLMDDDCYYLDPVEGMKQILRCFDMTQQVAAVGPTGSYRLFKKYKLTGREDQLFNQFPGPPWATLGSQVYRIKALRQCNLDFLNNLKFRMDVPLFLLLFGMGYMVGETNIRFNHKVSGGLNGAQYSSDFYRERLKQSAADYDVMWTAIKPQIDESQRNYVFHELMRCRNNEQNHTNKQLAKFLEGLVSI